MSCCPPGTNELPPVTIRGKKYCNCTGITLSGTVGSLEQQADEAQERFQRAMDAYRNGIRNSKTINDTYGYPNQTEDKNYPYKILGQVSRANQKANIFNKAFNPANRKMIVLMIAGFLLFLAVLNYD